MIIYLAKNIINNKVHIGKTIKTLEHRKAAHIRSVLKYDTKHNKRSLFYNAMKKYGYEKFLWEIIDSCTTTNELNNLEKFYIKNYDSQNRLKGYNINEGGEGGDCISKHPNLELIKQKISKSLTGRKMSEEFKIKNKERQIGRKVPKYIIEKIAAKRRGKPLSIEHRKALSTSLKGRTISEELKQKISVSLKGKKYKKRQKSLIKKKLSESTRLKIKESWKIRKEKGLYTKKFSAKTKALMSLKRKILWDKSKFLNDKIKVAIFGGAFDPITKGHILIINTLLEQKLVDQVWICPCHQHQFNKKMCDIHHRIKMIKIATRHNRKVAIKFKPSYIYILNYENVSTYDFIKNLSIEPNISIYDFSMVIGLDNALNFEKWKNFKELQELIKFIIIPRKGYNLDENVDWFLKAPHIYLSTIEIISSSSTEIRNILMTKQSSLLLNNLLDKKVYNYIIENKLYEI